jgi:hypothetical protein
VTDTPDSVDREIDALDTALRRLEAEYQMYFSGRLPRPPVETRNLVNAMVRRIDNQHIPNYGTRFRFTTLQTRFARFVTLWDNALRAKEEGRSVPFVARPAAEEPRRSPDESKAVPETPAARPKGPDRVLAVETFSDPIREMERVQGLYDQLTAARRDAGQDELPFHKFAELVKTQVSELKAKGSREVAFRVAVKDGKVALTAKPVAANRPGGTGTKE